MGESGEHTLVGNSLAEMANLPQPPNLHETPYNDKFQMLSSKTQGLGALRHRRGNSVIEQNHFSLQLTQGTTHDQSSQSMRKGSHSIHEISQLWNKSIVNQHQLMAANRTLDGKPYNGRNGGKYFLT